MEAYKERKEEIIALCKKHINENGTVRVGWAVEKILGKEQQKHVLDKIAATIIETGEYLKEPANINFKYDWNIRKNPDYKKESYVSKNPVLFEVSKIIFTAFISVLASVLVTTRNVKQETLQQYPQKEEMTKDNSQQLDSITKHNLGNHVQRQN